MSLMAGSSSSSSWLGTFARSVSGSLSIASLRTPQCELQGLELTQLQPNEECSACCSGPASQPIHIPGSSACPVAPAMVNLYDLGLHGGVAAPLMPSISRSTTPDEPQGRLPSVDDAQPAAPTTEGPIITDHHPLREQMHEQQRFSSSGDLGLPSALCPPLLPGPSSGNEPPGDKPTPGSEQQQRVRWLPGLLASAIPGKDNKQQNQPAAEGEAATAGPASSNPIGAGRDGTTCASGAAAAAAAPRCPAGKLPPSGSEPLDKYLLYLLQAAHPHKFMYYPNWGLSEAGCAAVGEFLRRDKRVKVMTLSGNNVRDDGVELIAEALAVNNTLVSLDLSDNKIGNIGAIALAEALHSNKCLAELQLNNNRIGDEGAEALAAAVASRTTLKKLHLSGNPISAAQQQVVQHVLKTRVYRMPTKQPSSSSLRSHLRKHSSQLQFHIELTDSDEVLKRVARHRQLPPSTTIAALSEPTDTLEESVGIQAARLIAELRSSIGAAPGDAGAARCAADTADGSTAGSSTQRTDLDSPSSGGSGRASASTSTELLMHTADILPLLAVRLAWRGYDVVLRTSCPSGLADGSVEQELAATPTARAYHSMMGLKHTTVRVVQPGMETDNPAVIVDPFFKEQFEVPHMTDRYQSVLQALPRVLCLAEHRLYHLVEALCSEMQLAFRESGLSCPPWRNTSAVLDKWLAKRPVDVVVDADSSVEQLKQSLTGK